MEALHARYPFLSAARDAVEAADINLAELAADEPVVDRATTRIHAAIDTEHVGELHRSPRVELLSYPLARVLVSLVDEPGLTRRYARAEAHTAYDRFTTDLEADQTLRSVERDQITLDQLLAEFDLQDAIQPSDQPATSGEYRIAVAEYLALADELDGERWRLAARTLADGEVAITRGELYELLRAAIFSQIHAGLPLSVPEQISETLTSHIRALREELADFAVSREIDAIKPDCYPPCMAALVERAADGELPATSRFSLVSFLCAIGMEPAEIASHFPSIDPDQLRSQVAHLRDDTGAIYPPPSCQSMVEYGDCVNKDALCGQIVHPLDYYERRLDGDTPADYASRAESQ